MKKEKQISIRIPMAAYENIEKAAKMQGVTVAAISREIILHGTVRVVNLSPVIVERLAEISTTIDDMHHKHPLVDLSEIELGVETLWRLLR